VINPDISRFFAGLAMAMSLLVGGCTTFSGAGDDAVQNLERGVEGRGRLVSPDEMGNEFGSYYD
jgi:predicted small secreted protein